MTALKSTHWEGLGMRVQDGLCGSVKERGWVVVLLCGGVKVMGWVVVLLCGSVQVMGWEVVLLCGSAMVRGWVVVLLLRPGQGENCLTDTACPESWK